MRFWRDYSGISGIAGMRLKQLSAVVLLAGALACAPEPTTPSDADLGGTWTAAGRAFTLSNITMNLVQEPQGIVSGTWTARAPGGEAGCPETTPCDASGNIIGYNTIAQVEIELLGAGKFEGGLVETNRMRGIFAIANAYDTITFVRVCLACSRESR